MSGTNLKVLSLFSGAMGLDLGLERAGLGIAGAVECNKSAVETIKLNRPDLPLFAERVEDITTQDLLRKAGLRRGGAFVVSGGPSCQAFSTAGQRGSLEDPRGELFREFVRIVDEARPRFFIMENVRGLLSAAIRHRPLNKRGPGHPPLAPDEELGSALRVVVDDLRTLGYYVKFDVLNAADFGVPQDRRRLVFLGSRDGEPIRMPAPTHAEGGAGGLTPWATLSQALAGTGFDPDYYDFSPGKLKYLKRVPAGGNWRDLPKDEQAAALGKAHESWGGRSGFFRRLDWDKPSPTLNTRPDSKATSLCHPTEVRPLTVGEYAQIQQFPSDWAFSGSVREKYRQLGNAVPLGLGEAVGRVLAELASRRRQADPSRCGVVECDNLDLLARLANRPLTIYNPPRMRGSDGAALSAWRDGRQIMRTDFRDYAPETDREALEALIASRRRKAPAIDDLAIAAE